VSDDFWILAHPDDEIFGIPIWFDTNNKSVFYYLVTEPAVRVSESKNVAKYLEKRGLKVETYYSNGKFKDGEVSRCLNQESLGELIQRIMAVNPNRLIVLADEYGHQDHDFVNRLAKLISQYLRIELIQVLAYRNVKAGFGYQVMNTDQPISGVARNSLNFVRTALEMAFIYRSQWKSWVGLLPGILIGYSKRDFRFLEDKDKEVEVKVWPPLYEKRKRSTLYLEQKQIEILADLFRSNYS
jgi:hypothetical protein